MNKMLREIEGIQISKTVSINGRQKRVTVLDREAVMNEMYTRIFKNITFEEVEIIEMPCMISSPRDGSVTNLDKGVNDLVKESGRGWDSD